MELAFSPIVILAVGLIELLVVIGLMALFIYLGRSSERKSLLYAILFAFSTLLGIWIVDKTAAYQLKLLTESESGILFSLVKDALLLVFGYYFGSASKSQDALED